jgi:hypothetical protein
VVHLLSLNLIVYAAVSLAVFVVLLLIGLPVERAGPLALSVAGVSQLATLAMMYFGWRYIPFFGRFIFPNLAGKWFGKIEYVRNGDPASLDATLLVDQNLVRISLVLLTAQAESDTLVVYPKKLSNGRFELHYIYETRRRPGRPPPFYKYRGTAELRVGADARTLEGTYYTEQKSGGSVRFARPKKP